MNFINSFRFSHASQLSQHGHPLQAYWRRTGTDFVATHTIGPMVTDDLSFGVGRQVPRGDGLPVLW